MCRSFSLNLTSIFFPSSRPFSINRQLDFVAAQSSDGGQRLYPLLVVSATPDSKHNQCAEKECAHTYKYDMHNMLELMHAALYWSGSFWTQVRAGRNKVQGTLCMIVGGIFPPRSIFLSMQQLTAKLHRERMPSNTEQIYEHRALSCIEHETRNSSQKNLLAPRLVSTKFYGRRRYDMAPLFNPRPTV